MPCPHASARGGLRVDLNVVDAIVNDVARSALASGSLMRRLQTGVVTHYAASMIGGVLAAIVIYSVAWGAHEKAGPVFLETTTLVSKL